MAQVEIVNFGVFHGEGAKTVHSDKIWANVKIDGTLVSCWGRRNSTLSFKTRAGVSGRKDAESKWIEKTGGRKSGDVYTSVTSPSVRKMLCPNLESDITSFFYSKMARGMLRTG